MCTDYLSNSTLFPLGTTHLPGPCSVCTKKHTKGRDDCNDDQLISLNSENLE